MSVDRAPVSLFNQLSTYRGFKFQRAASPTTLNSVSKAGYDLGSVADYYKIHNGQAGLAVLPDETGPFRWLSLKESLAEAKRWSKMASEGAFPSAATPDRGIRAMWWCDGWLPIGANGLGDFLCLDLAPAKGGTKGQILRVLHDDPARNRVAKSLDELLMTVVTGLRTGALVCSDELGGVVPVGELTEGYDASDNMGIFEGPLVVDSTLEKVARMVHIDYLNLTGARVTDTGLRQLAPLRKLKSVMLRKTLVTDKGILWLLDNFPLLEDLALPPAATSALVDAIGNHPALQTVGTSGSKFGKRAQEATMARNPTIEFF